MTEPHTSTDPLGDALHFLRMSSTYYSRCEFGAPWGLTLPAMPGALMFHVVTSGRCWLEAGGGVPCALRPGDLALVPHGDGHRLCSEPGVPGTPLGRVPREEVSERFEILRHGGHGDGVGLVCGTVRFDHPAAQRLIALLPRVITVDASAAPHAEWFLSTVHVMAAEAMAMRPGGESIVARLADVLVIQAIRTWVEQGRSAQAGWLGALRDRHVGRALTLIHRDPARRWTLASLAAEVAMSRSAFAARFAALVGEPVMQYLVRWRMHVALVRLRDHDAPIHELADELGYRSEAAFSRAFKRVVGVPPGLARRRGTTTREGARLG